MMGRLLSFALCSHQRCVFQIDFGNTQEADDGRTKLTRGQQLVHFVWTAIFLLGGFTFRKICD